MNTLSHTPEKSGSTLLTTNRKALTINLDPTRYGTFAEIGAGQEVARCFFQAGGAAGTIAKSMSAYDMIFSDSIYGKTKRYVSKDRLDYMLKHEYNLLQERLKETRGASTLFFTYANTVAAKSFKGNNECHGWMGVRLQYETGGPFSDVMIHIRLLDDSNLKQQEVLGIIGVNLLYASFYYPQNMDIFIPSLVDHLTESRVEVDMITFDGPQFEGLDNRVQSLKLVEYNLTQAVLFGSDGDVIQPSEAFYKKSILVERGSFRPVTHVNVDMVQASSAQFIQEPAVKGEDIMILMELTLRNLKSLNPEKKQVEIDDFLARIDTINSLGYPVLISNYFEYFRLSAYFRRYTNGMIGIVMGINNVIEVFREKYYESLEGGILEAFGRLFKEKVKIYVYPMKGSSFDEYRKLADKADDVTYTDPHSKDSAANVYITAQNVQVGLHLRNLYAYLLENHYIEPVISFDERYMEIFSRDVFDKLQVGDPTWTQMVPAEVAKIIKSRKLWGYEAAKEAKRSSKSKAVVPSRPHAKLTSKPGKSRKSTQKKTTQSQSASAKKTRKPRSARANAKA